MADRIITLTASLTPEEGGYVADERTVIVPLNRDPLRIGTQSDILAKVGTTL